MTSEPRIGKEFYDSSDYFEEGTDHLIDTESRFQRYRINKVLSIHEPKPSDRVVDLGCGFGLCPGGRSSPPGRDVSAGT